MSRIVEPIYLQQIKALPVTERLLLTRLIMDDLSKSVSRWVVDSDDAWNDEDLSDLSRASLEYSAQMLEKIRIYQSEEQTKDATTKNT